jgi:hypothetical protein
MGEDNSERQFLNVATRPRECRVAFMIDPAETRIELLDSIFEASTGVWGGRLFPIIPVIGGEIPSQHWQLLKAYDPDLVYTYAPLPQYIVDRIQVEIDPLRIHQHPPYLLQGEQPHFAPSELDDLIPLNSLLLLELEPRWFYKPVLMTYDDEHGYSPDPLIARNFGIIRKNRPASPIPDGITQCSFKKDTRIASFLDLVVSERNTVVFPYNLAAAQTSVNLARDTHETTYTIFVGDSVENWVSYWNHIFTQGQDWRKHWRAICLPADKIVDSETQRAFFEFLRKVARRIGDHPPTLHWVSCTHSEEDLHEISAPFRWKKLDPIKLHSQRKMRQLDAISRVSRRKEWDLPTLKPEGAISFGLPTNTSAGPDQIRTSFHQVPRTGGFFNPTALPFRFQGDKRWMQDVCLQYIPKHDFYVNEDLAYKLPRKNGLARIFSEAPGRMSLQGRLSFEMRQNVPLPIRIPDDQNILLTAIGCGIRIGYDAELRLAKLPPAYEGQAPSDKAKYCRGVVDLFGGIQAASQFFDSHFWRRIFNELAGCDAKSSVTAIANKIRKHPDRWVIDASSAPDVSICKIADQIVRLIQGVKAQEGEITLQYLEEQFRLERREFYKGNPDYEAARGTTEEEEEQATREDLRRTLQELVDGGILRQGVASRCKHCGSRIWRELSELSQRYACEGCGAGVHTAVDSRWYYRINSLLREAVAHHGTVALISALAKLRERARGSFIYSPGIEFYEKYEDVKPATEIDIVCILDGQLWVGEVKSKAGEFSQTEIDKLIAASKRLQADKTFLFALDGDQQSITNTCNRLKAEGCQVDLVQVWPSLRAAEPSLHV